MTNRSMTNPSMNGIINVLKPPGMTSHDVVSFLRKRLKTKKVGHTGTLDPEAAGVLPICVGKGTKTVQYLTDKKKKYRANIKFGAVTDTYDKYGSIIEEKPAGDIDSEKLKQVIQTFLGEIQQYPPIYSAIKYNGKKLYEYAREGQEVDIKARQVEIYSIDLIDIVAPDEAVLDIYCSKGTYIRSLCHDIGQQMGPGAYMSQLVRIESSPFTLEDAYTLEEIDQAAAAGQAQELLKPVDEAFAEFPRLTIKATARNSAQNGNPLYKAGVMEDIDTLELDKLYRIYDADEFLAVGALKYNEAEQRRYLQIKNLFI